jgi:hypothetical protein
MARLILAPLVVLAVTQLAFTLNASPSGNYAAICSQVARTVSGCPFYYPGTVNAGLNMFPAF